LEKKNLGSEQNIVIIGGGLPGIISSLYLSNIYPNNNIHLIENSSKLGGLYTSINDPIGGVFDKGMHIIYETCIDEIDSLINQSLPKDEWIYLEGNKKDIAGIFFNGELQANSPYININNINEKIKSQCLSDLLLTFNKVAPNFNECKTAREFFEKRFGKSITNEIIEPIIKKLWKTPSAKLHPSVTRIVLMDRLLLFEEEAMIELMRSSIIRCRLGYPNQLKLDLSYRNNQKGLYPKNFGMQNLIDKLQKKLYEKKINIYLNSEIEKIIINNKQIEEIFLRSNSKIYSLNSIKLLHSTVSPLSLLKKFNLNINTHNYDKPLNQKYIYMLLKNPPQMENIYYFFSFEKGTKTYRITNYANYCSNAKRSKEFGNLKESWPICCELHYDSCLPSDEEVLKDTIKELKKFKIISSESEILFSRIDNAGGFPLLTINNCKILSEANKAIKDLSIKNFIMGSQSPEKGIFFLHDILSNIYKEINNFRKDC
tara:strand:- start:562 stop:2016 length:1455 start_codon:yes stop_codon:yes gene_type:complete